jgi:ketosteroid isomerase-like protein
MAILDTSVAAEGAFYRAFERGDLEAMMSVWADLPEIKCIHPLGTVLTGAAAIRASWLELFRAQLPRKFEIERVNLIQASELFIHTVFETITLPLQRQRFPPLLATNVYRKVNGEWRMILHHASPVGMVEAAAFEAAEPAATRH